MSGIDPAVASALASRIDMLLNAISGTTDATAARAADAASSTQWANAQPAKTGNAPPVPPPASAQAELSETALALNIISRTGGEEAPPVIGRQPLWSTAPDAGAASRTSAAALVTQPGLDGLASSLAMALEQALDTSGLFYESHLVQWLAGQRSTALLGQEPQARLPHADSEAGWPFDPEQAQQDASDTSNAAPPFTGRPAPGTTNTTASMTGNEMVDVEIVEAESTPGQATGKVRVAPAGDDVPDAGLPPGSADLDGPGASLLANASRNASPNAAPGTALTNPNAQPGSPGGAAAPTANGSTFSSSANAAYTAQQAANSTLGNIANPAAAASHAGAPQLTQLQANGLPASLPIHPDALAIVRQQLELLQSAEPQFRWSGEAWPNSKMYWELDWDPDDTRAANQRIWRTRISLELPTLGFVDAELTLTGHQLGARITADGQSIGMLKEGTSDFMRALASAGLDLQQLAIRDADGSLPVHPQAVGTEQ
jgi:Flagellar hook-length control protein FliK